MIQQPKIYNNKQDSKGYTALSLAAQVALTEIGEKILDFDQILVNSADQSVKQTALMLAAERIIVRCTIPPPSGCGAKFEEYQ